MWYCKWTSAEWPISELLHSISWISKNVCFQWKLYFSSNSLPTSFKLGLTEAETPWGCQKNHLRAISCSVVEYLNFKYKVFGANLREFMCFQLKLYFSSNSLPTSFKLGLIEAETPWGCQKNHLRALSCSVVEYLNFIYRVFSANLKGVWGSRNFAPNI